MKEPLISRIKRMDERWEDVSKQIQTLHDAEVRIAERLTGLLDNLCSEEILENKDIFALSIEESKKGTDVKIKITVVPSISVSDYEKKKEFEIELIDFINEAIPLDNSKLYIDIDWEDKR